MKKIYKKN